MRMRAFIAAVALLTSDVAGFLLPSRASPVVGSRGLSALSSSVDCVIDREDVQRAAGYLLGVTKGSDDWGIDLRSPSKINLFLRIVKRRDDG
jgi:hypothetical protein